MPTTREIMWLIYEMLVVVSTIINTGFNFYIIIHFFSTKNNWFMISSIISFSLNHIASIITFMLCVKPQNINNWKQKLIIPSILLFTPAPIPACAIYALNIYKPSNLSTIILFQFETEDKDGQLRKDILNTIITKLIGFIPHSILFIFPQCI